MTRQNRASKPSSAPQAPTGRHAARLLTAGAALSLLTLAAAPTAGQTCPSGPLNSPKSQALYVYFPTASDATFPEYGSGDTSPIDPFTMANHDNTINTGQVRNRAFELMQAGYCEFDVELKLTTAVPAPTETRWQIVGIGSDTSDAGGLVGEAQDVDTNDNDPQDYSRVWVENLETYTGTELSGANSTMERWARAIANLAAHESAHNYGGSHGEAAPRPGEDAAGNHFIADPGTGASASTVSDSFNHFGDRTYERLGHDIGLNAKTLGNWDFVNPNSTNADKLVITLLSSATTLTRGWWFNGSTSPWREPSLTKRAGTLSYRGTNYNVFDLEFSTAKAWSGGPNGEAPPGVEFHVGASVNEPDPVIVYEATLSNGGTDLDLHPRIFGYDAGITAGGSFAVSFFNTGAADSGFLQLSNVSVLFLPRMLDLEQMVAGGELLTTGGAPIVPFQRRPRGRQAGAGSNDRYRTSIEGPIQVGDDPFVLPIAHLTDSRHLDEVITADPGCKRGRETIQGPGFGTPSVRYCPTAGDVLSLFPATYVYVSATVTEPNARQWDPSTSQFINAPLETRIFFQSAGIVPDANDNGVDDLVDIRNGTSTDNNDNGIPDEAERGGRWAVSAHLGLTSPDGVASRVLDDGFGLDIGIERVLTSQFSVLGILGYDNLDARGSGSDLDILHLSVNGRFYFNTGPVLPFAQAGIGIYDLSPGSTELGYNAAVGLRWDFATSTSLELLYKRHEVQTGGANLEYSAAQIGLRWKL